MRLLHTVCDMRDREPTQSETDLGRPTPFEQSMRARMAAHVMWSKTPDWTARTAPARKAALDRFEKAVDPDGVLDPAERAKRAAAARSAHFTQLAYRSVRARRLKAQGAKDKKAPS
jgi:hypothetical protein